MEPITRVEQFLAKAAGITSDCPEPRTRVEMFLQKIAENGGGPGGSSINVTAAVGQTIRVKAVDENGKPTEWEAVDYQPRTHWTEETVILPEATYEYDAENDDWGIPAVLINDTEYKVVYNGTEYTTRPFFFEENGYHYAVLGNTDAFLEIGDNGIPFIFCSSVDDNFTTLMPFEEVTSVTMSIVEIKCTPIPVKYIPEYVYRVDVSQFSGGIEYQASELPKALILAAYDGIPLYLLVTDEYGRAVKMPASFAMSQLVAIVTTLDNYADPIPASDIAGLVPKLCARGAVGGSMQDWHVRWSDGT